MVQLPRNEKQTYRLNCMPQMWPLDLTLAMTLTLEIQGQIWNLLYLNQKWSDFHEMKSKHIDWMWPLVWPWPWHWPWNFKVKFWNSCISGIRGTIDIEQEGCESVIHDHDYDLLVTKVRGRDLPDSGRGGFRYWRAVDSSTFRAHVRSACVITSSSSSAVKFSKISYANLYNVVNLVEIRSKSLIAKENEKKSQNLQSAPHLLKPTTCTATGTWKRFSHYWSAVWREAIYIAYRWYIYHR